MKANNTERTHILTVFENGLVGWSGMEYVTRWSQMDNAVHRLKSVQLITLLTGIGFPFCQSSKFKDFSEISLFYAILILIPGNFSFSALTLLVGRQEKNPTGKNLGVVFLVVTI